MSDPPFRAFDPHVDKSVMPRYRKYRWRLEKLSMGTVDFQNQFRDFPRR